VGPKSRAFSAFLLLAAAPLVAALPSIKGELTDDDPVHPDYGVPADEHQFEAKEGQLMVITVRPTPAEADTVLFLAGPSGQSFANDDAPDGEGGSQLEVVAEEGGSWTATVGGLTEDVRCAYTLTIEQRTLELATKGNGELTDDDRVLLKAGERADVLDFDVVAGAAYVVQLVSEDFDAFLSVHLNGEVLTSDDHFEMNSQVTFTALEAGKAKLVFTSSGAEGRGRYGYKVFRVKG